MERRGYIGGSDISAIVGCNPYRGPLDVYLDKVGEAVPFAGNENTRWGNALEAVIAERYSEETGLVLEQPAAISHPSKPFLVGHLDRIAPSVPRVIEIKTAGHRQAHRWGDPGTDQIPEEYLLQVLFYLGLTGYETADVPVLVGGNDFRVYTVAHDRDLSAALFDRAERFWRDHVEAKRPPPLDGSDSARAWLERQFPRAVGEVKPATGEADEWAARLREAREAREAAEAAEELAKNHLCRLIGEDKGVRGEWGKAAWINNKGRAVTKWEAVAQEANVPQDLIEKHTSRKPFRMFRVDFAEPINSKEQ